MATLTMIATLTMMATVTVSRYVHYKRIKASLLLGKANADVLASSPRLALSVGSARSLMTDTIALCLAASSARCCYLALAIRPINLSTSSICEITSDLDDDNEPETAVKRHPLPPVAWMTALPADRQHCIASDTKTLPEPMAQDRETDAIAEHAVPSVCLGELSFPLEPVPMSGPMLISDPLPGADFLPDLELKLEPEPEPEPKTVYPTVESLALEGTVEASSQLEKARSMSRRPAIGIREIGASADHTALSICLGELGFLLRPKPELEPRSEPEPEPGPGPVLVSEPTGSVIGVEEANGPSTRRRKRTRSKRCAKYRASMKQSALPAACAEA
ncbi:hypothetical protein LPJ56_005331 [Coemansia sp. RSA 2599]|nr:hypothetical protein LPJ56_005331 [Coemansia sp. RSA 2599]